MQNLAKLLLVIVLLCPHLAGAVELKRAAWQTYTLGGKKVASWAPHETASGKWPLVIFSHGFKGCATQSTFLMEALADDGYWVVAPTHQDADCGEAFTRDTELPEAIFGEVKDWSQDTYIDRAKDIHLLVATMKLDPQFSSIDFSKIALIGHALGGYTVMGLAGAWPEWKLDGVKAVVALSPFSQPYAYRRTLGGLQAPIMYELGTRDNGISSSAKDDQSVYETSPEPKYYIQYDGATRFSWTDVSKSYQPSIITYTLAFLDHYVKGQPAVPALTTTRMDVLRMKYDSELGHSISGTP